MKSAVSIFSMIALGLLAAGCATSLTAKGQTSSAQKVAALESQVGTLNQRLEEMTQRHQALEGEIRTLRGSRESARSSADASVKTAKALSVRQVQQTLAKAGFYQGPVDGKIGPKTQEAIKAFQKAQGLNPDGVVGSKTSVALAKYLEE